eukprot:6189535-Pleurochrysis_carterae.AAC.3
MLDASHVLAVPGMHEAVKKRTARAGCSASCKSRILAKTVNALVLVVEAAKVVISLVTATAACATASTAMPRRGDYSKSAAERILRRASSHAYCVGRDVYEIFKFEL